MPINPLKLLEAPVSALVGVVGSILDNLTLSGEEKLAAQQKVMDASLGFQRELLKADAEFAKYQAEVLMAETKSESWLTRSWRPLLMLSFGAILMYNWIISQLFHLPTATVPVDLWDLLKIGVGGYVVGRSAEKVAPAVAEVFKKQS